MIKLAIFDLDGFLLQGSRFSDFLEKEYHVSKPEFLGILRGRVMPPKCDINTPSFPAWEPYLSVWGLHVNEQEFFDLWFKTEGTHEVMEHFELVKKAKSQVEKVAVMSDNFFERADWIKKTFPSLQLFDFMYFSCENGFTKATEQSYKMVLEHFKVTPDETLFIDDDEDSAKLAASLGIHAIYFQNAEQLKQEFFQVGLSG